MYIKFGRKCDQGVKKVVNFFAQFVNWAIIWANYKEPKNKLQTNFLLGVTVASSWNSCAAQFSHYDSDPVDRLL